MLACNLRLVFTALAFFIGVSLVSVARAFDCGGPPPVADESLKADINAGAKGIAGKLLQANVGGQIQTSRSEIYSKYKNPDLASADRYFQYEVCQIVNSDHSLTSQQKLDMVFKARQAFSVLSGTMPAPVVTKPPNPPVRHPLPKPPVSGPAVPLKFGDHFSLTLADDERHGSVWINNPTGPGSLNDTPRQIIYAANPTRGSRSDLLFEPEPVTETDGSQNGEVILLSKAAKLRGMTSSVDIGSDPYFGVASDGTIFPVNGDKASIFTLEPLDGDAIFYRRPFRILLKEGASRGMYLYVAPDGVLKLVNAPNASRFLVQPFR